jgi:hypothetical protein
VRRGIRVRVKRSPEVVEFGFENSIWNAAGSRCSSDFGFQFCSAFLLLLLGGVCE